MSFKTIFQIINKMSLPEETLFSDVESEALVSQSMFSDSLASSQLMSS